MKRRICVRSMMLGATIMLIGLAVGAIVSPPLTAQHNGVFDEITCRSLKVVDKEGKPAVMLASGEDANLISIHNKQGEVAVGLNSRGGGGSVDVFGKDSGMASMSITDHSGIVEVSGKGGGAAHITTDEQGGRVEVLAYIETGFPSASGQFLSGTRKTTAAMFTGEHGGRVSVYNNQGKNCAAMGVNEYGNGGVSTWDKNGYRQ